MRVEELLKKCREDKTVDDQSLRFTQPDYYINNVQVSTYDDEKIKEMMRNVDRKVVARFFSDEYNFECEERSRSSLASIEVVE